MFWKRAMIAGMHHAGVLGMARRVNRGQFLGATVLLYHRVLPADCRSDHYAALMGDPTVPQLEALIRYLKRWFRFSTPAECVEKWRQGKEVDPFTLLLTFDDGYLDMYEHLLPVLQRCEVPATVFVTTGAMGGYLTWCQRLFAAVDGAARAETPPFDHLPAMPLRSAENRVAVIEAVSSLQCRHAAPEWECLIDGFCEKLGWDGRFESERMMGWAEVEALARSGLVTVGGHTVTHPLLDRCEATQVCRELFDSADELRGRLGPGFLPFSYPQGRCPSEQVQSRVREAGYDCAFTGRWTANTSATSLYQLGRQHLPPNDIPRASLLLSGLRSRPAAPVLVPNPTAC